MSLGRSTPTAGPIPAAATAHRRLPVLRPTAGSGSRTPSTRTGSAAPRANSAGVTTARLLHNFDGVNALDNKAASGFDLEPPDQGLGAGNGYVVNFVNVIGQIQSTSGALLVRPFYLNTFFHGNYSAASGRVTGVAS